MMRSAAESESDPSANFHWIWPRHSVMKPDGSLYFKTSGVDGGESHWSSQEEFPSNHELYPAMRWIFENRRKLPRLIGRNLIPVDLFQKAPLKLPPDGVYALFEERFVEGWNTSLEVQVSVINPENTSEDLCLLMKLTGANCFLFMHSTCEYEISVGDPATDKHILPKQALRLLHSVLNET